MSPDTFLDSNVLLRHILHDHEDHSRRATALIRRLELGEDVIRTADTVVFETVFTLEKFYKIPRDVNRDLVLPIVELSAVELPGKQALREVFDIYVDHRGLSFADCYHVVLTRGLGLEKIMSFDRGLDRLSGVKRVEPE